MREILKFNFETMGKRKFLFFENHDKVEIAKICQKVYQKRESEDQKGDFGFGRTKKIDKGTLSKIYEKI